MNIGKWIVVSFMLFATFMAALVTVCMRQDISLVSKSYYDEEIKFQSQIERERNTQQLEKRPSVELHGTELTLAWNQNGPVTSATISLFCPSNAKMDRTFSLPEGNTSQILELAEMNKGMYRVKLRWTMDNKEFYQEEVINL
ncbi:MAG: FixH family protein [Chryseolinea sp.]